MCSKLLRKANIQHGYKCRTEYECNLNFVAFSYVSGVCLHSNMVTNYTIIGEQGSWIWITHECNICCITIGSSTSVIIKLSQSDKYSDKEEQKLISQWHHSTYTRLNVVVNCFIPYINMKNLSYMWRVNLIKC